MIQDIAPLRLANEYQDKKVQKNDRLIGFSGKKIFLWQTDEGITYPTYEEIENACRKQERAVPECRFLFAIGEENFFLAEPDGIEPFGEYRFYEMFETRAMVRERKELVFAGATAWHLYQWYRDNRFCGRCAAKLVHEEKLRALRCPACGNLIFPKIAPAVIVAVTNGENILMTKYANRQYKRYALIAGFTEIGETAEETVVREVMEETGVRVKNIRYYKSQPWGFDSNLLLGYFCELDGDDTITMDSEELSVAEWVHYTDVPADVEGLSLTREMMTKFKTSFAGEERHREINNYINS